MANDLEKKIITQLEYYFGDINLPRDKFLKETIEKTEGGWVTLDTLLTFKRLADLSKDKKIIVDALEKSEAKLIEISDDKEKLRRSTEKPLPELTTEERQLALQPRTAYAKGFPKDEKFDNIMEFLRTHGTIDSLNMRSYKDKATNSVLFKGSVNIIFKDEEECKKFIAAESIKYKDTELERLSQADFTVAKKAEFEEKKLKKGKRGKEGKDAAPEIKVDYPSKTVIKLTGSTVAEKLNWNEIKAKVKEVSEIEAAHVDFKSGQTEGYMRFANENEAEEFMKKVPEGKLQVGDIEFQAVAIEDAEEAKYYQNWKREMINRKNRSKGGKPFGKKRKGNFNKDSPKSKKQQQQG